MNGFNNEGENNATLQGEHQQLDTLDDSLGDDLYKLNVDNGQDVSAHNNEDAFNMNSEYDPLATSQDYPNAANQIENTTDYNQFDFGSYGDTSHPSLESAYQQPMHV
jgi:hypothetical protein